MCCNRPVTISGNPSDFTGDIQAQIRANLATLVGVNVNGITFRVALLPFELLLIGQQLELSDADRTFELGYLLYATASYSGSTTGGPTTGGTLVTITGRGFARASARATSARVRARFAYIDRSAAASFPLGGLVVGCSVEQKTNIGGRSRSVED